MSKDASDARRSAKSLITFKTVSEVIQSIEEDKDNDEYSYSLASILPCSNFNKSEYIESDLCSCFGSFLFGGIMMHCNVTSTADYNTIRSFVRNTTTIFDGISLTQVYFNLQSADQIPVPSDLLDSGSLESLMYVSFICPNNSVPLGPVALDAFPVANSLGYFYIYDCDLNDFSFDFLQSLTLINEIHVSGSSFSTFNSMPTIPSITTVKLSNCTGFQQWYPPSQTTNLTSIWIDYSNLTDTQIDGIFDSMGDTYSDQLTKVFLDGNELTSVPPFVLTLSKLDELNMSNNSIKMLPSNSLDFISHRLRFLILEHNQIGLIAPGAFDKGNYIFI